MNHFAVQRPRTSCRVLLVLFQQPFPTRNIIIPRLTAAFQRGCFFDDDAGEHPSGKHTFYQGELCSHYATIVHECVLDGKRDAFAYDNICCDGGDGQSGKVEAADSTILGVIVGGVASHELDCNEITSTLGQLSRFMPTATFRSKIFGLRVMLVRRFAYSPY